MNKLILLFLFNTPSITPNNKAFNFRNLLFSIKRIFKGVFIKYNFTKCFLGVNGISIDNGFTTPDMQEAHVKTEVMRHSKKSYIIADRSKFNVCSSITFADIMDASIITIQGISQEYKDETNIIEVAM